MPDHRAISDALGFIMVFAIIISTVAIVYTGGFQSLNNARQYERMNNAERAFEVLDDNIEDIVQRGAPSRATEIKLDRAALLGGDSQVINVTVTEGAASEGESISRSYHPIVYESQTDKNNRMVYALGATFRASKGGTVMSTEPTWILEDNRIIIPIVQTRHDDGVDVVGSDTILVRTWSSGVNIPLENTTGESDVYVNVTSPRASAWKDYMEEQDPAVDCSQSNVDDDEANCKVEDVEVVYVTRIVINYEFL